MLATSGVEREGWRVSAEKELVDNFMHRSVFRAATGADMARHALATAHPDRLRLADENQTLEDAGVKDKSIVAVEPR